MATIRKRNGKWQVQVRRKGSPALSRTFTRKADAEAWARDSEVLIERRGVPLGFRDLKNVTLGQLIERYRQEVLPSKRGWVREDGILRAFAESSGLAACALDSLGPANFARYRDRRLASVSAATVVRELAVLGHLFHTAIRDWGLPLDANPVASVSKPKLRNSRTRRLETGAEFEALAHAVRKCRNQQIWPFIQLALETGMRRGEILALRWEHIDQVKCTLHIPMTKNGHPRTIPLSSKACAILKGLEVGTGRVFSLTANSVRLSWERLRVRAGLPDLRFHDLRHEAVSRFFELGLSVPEVALISGHRDTRMLMRYTHLRPEDVAKKLG